MYVKYCCNKCCEGFQYEEQCVEHEKDCNGEYDLRFTTKNCESCKFVIVCGGDSVPYGSTTATLPDYIQGCKSDAAMNGLTDDEYDLIVNGEANCSFWEEFQD